MNIMMRLLLISLHFRSGLLPPFFLIIYTPPYTTKAGDNATALLDGFHKIGVLCAPLRQSNAFRGRICVPCAVGRHTEA